MNTPFAGAEQEVIPELPFWKQPGIIQMAKTAGKYLLMALALFILYLRVLKPMLKKLSEAMAQPPASHAQLAACQCRNDGPPRQRNYQENLARAQKMAKEDPRVVANIVKTWVGGNE